MKEPMQVGGKYIAVPMPTVKRTKTQVIAKSDLPANLKDSFVITASDGRKYIGVRRGRGRGQVVLLYELIRSARIKPRLGLASDTIKTLKLSFVKNLQAAAEQAMRTARR